MSKGQHSEAEMIGALKQLEAGRTAADVARELGVSKHTIYAWKAKYGGLDVSQAQELRQLTAENHRLKRLVADLSLDKEMLKAVIAKNGWSS
jgi:putative transposase